MVARTQINRSRTNGARPPEDTRQVGELFVNLPDMQMSVINSTHAADDLLAVRFWTTETTFHAGDIVWRTGDLRRCIPANSTPGTFVGSEWDTLATMNDITSAAVGATEGLKPYSELATYVPLDLVTYEGSIYRCVEEILVPEPWTEAHWLDIIPPPLPEPLPMFSDMAAYALNDLVVRNGSIYRCTTPVPEPSVPEPFDPADWLVIAPVTVPPNNGPDDEPPQDGNYYVRRNHDWVRTALWSTTGTDVVLAISGTAVIRIQPGGDLLVKGDVEVFSVGV